MQLLQVGVALRERRIKQASIAMDYSKLTQIDFEREIKKYVVFRIMNDEVLVDEENEDVNEEVE